MKTQNRHSWHFVVAMNPKEDMSIRHRRNLLKLDASVMKTFYLSAVVSVSIDNGSSDPDGDTLTLTQSPAGPYPVGNTW